MKPHSFDQQVSATARSFTKRKAAKMALLSSLFLVFAGALVSGTFFAIRSAKEIPRPDEEFPESSNNPSFKPSSSILGEYRQQAVAADALECSQIGNEILLKNGSAVEAAIAATLCSGLYHAHSCGIGGGFFMVTYDRTTGKAMSFNAREKAPAAATELMFVENRNISSVEGWHAIAVPGEIAGYYAAYQHGKSGHISWRELFEPSINLARNGFTVNEMLASAIEEKEKDILAELSMREMFTNNDPTNPRILRRGDKIFMHQLAKTLETIADDPSGVDAFYRGEIAKSLVNDIQNGGGIITMDDLEHYVVQMEDALRLVLQDNSSVYGTPPPAGNLILQYIVNVMDGYGYQSNWERMSDDEKNEFYQRFAETMKFAYARRTEMGDEDFVPEVREMRDTLLSHWFAQLTRNQINDRKTSNDTQYYGVKITTDISKTGTAHISVLDKHGNAASITSTINTHFGSRRISRSTGIILNNEMDDFTTNPTQPNYYGLPPSHTNRIAPGKRPQSSCSPTIVVDRDGDVKAVIGASGGSRIISATANALLRILYFDQDVKTAIDSPRLYHQLVPMRLEYEPGFYRPHLSSLKAKGHEVSLPPLKAVVQGIVRAKNGTIYANCDYRKRGAPAGL